MQTQTITEQILTEAPSAGSESLPISKELLMGLFDFLDIEVGTKGCQHNYDLTLRFFTSRSIELDNTTVSWFQQHGRFCDCEILYNIEEKFEQL